MDVSVGGSADVAHKDLDDSPRKMVLKNQPIQLSSAVLDMGSGSFADELGKEDCVPTKNEPSIRVLNLTANSRLSADGNLQASQRYVPSQCIEMLLLRLKSTISLILLSVDE